MPVAGPRAMSPTCRCSPKTSPRQRVLYRMDLANAKLTSLGSINTTPAGDLIDIAIRPDTRPATAAAASGVAAVATGPVLGLSTRTLDFAEQAVGIPSAPRVITVSNDGDADLEIRAAAGQPGPFSSSYQCPDFLPPAENLPDHRPLHAECRRCIEQPDHRSDQCRLITRRHHAGRPRRHAAAGPERDQHRLRQPPDRPADAGRNAGTAQRRQWQPAVSTASRSAVISSSAASVLLRWHRVRPVACGSASGRRPAGPRNGELSITSNAAASPQRVRLTGSGRRLLDGRN